MRLRSRAVFDDHPPLEKSRPSGCGEGNWQLPEEVSREGIVSAW